MQVTDAEIGAYYVGDMPSQSGVIVVDGDLSRFSNVSVSLTDPNGASATHSGIATIDTEEDQISIDLSGDYFDTPGLWTLQLVLTGSGVKESLSPVGFVVELEDGWHSLSSARNEWPDAPENDVQLFTLLSISKQQVAAYAPTVEANEVLVAGGLTPDPDHPGLWIIGSTSLLGSGPVPMNWKQAQLLQSRNNWNASKVDAGNGQIGTDTFVIRPFPMDWTVKNTIRPKRAIPVVG